MVQMMNETCKYCKKTTVELGYAIIGSDKIKNFIDNERAKHKKYKERKDIDCINAIVEEESHFYYKGERSCKCNDYTEVRFNEDAKAINLECIIGNRCKSVDMVIGLDNAQFLLVELKLKATDGYFMDEEHVKNQLKESRDNIMKPIGKSIYKSILIYCRGREIVKACLNRIILEGGEMPDILTLQQFKQAYF